MSRLLDSMAAYGADTEGVLDRFMDDEELYATCLDEFVETTDLEGLHNYIDAKDYDNAFEVAHALKVYPVISVLRLFSRLPAYWLKRCGVKNTIILKRNIRKYLTKCRNFLQHTKVYKEIS